MAINLAAGAFSQAGSSSWVKENHKRGQYKADSKRLYAEARKYEAQIREARTEPEFPLFAEGLPRDDGTQRLYHCRRMRAYWEGNKRLMRIERGITDMRIMAGEAEWEQSRAHLRELRCMIMEEAVEPPPAYQETE